MGRSLGWSNGRLRNYGDFAQGRQVANPVWQLRAARFQTRPEFCRDIHIKEGTLAMWERDYGPPKHAAAIIHDMIGVDLSEQIEVWHSECGG